MKLQRGKDVGQFVELGFKPGSWEKEGIPEQGCRLRTSALEKLLSSGGQIDADELIYGLMDWLDVTAEPEAALVTLRLLVNRHHPAEPRSEGSCRFEDERGVLRSFHVGPVDCSQDLIAWQRDGWIIALAQASNSDPGRIIVAAPGPISREVAMRILAVGMQRFMDEPFDSYQGGVAMSGSTTNFYAWRRGETTTCHWPRGLGKREHLGQLVDCSDELYCPPRDQWLTPNQVAIMVGIAAGYLH